jgi:hypothetical protein
MKFAVVSVCMATLLAGCSMSLGQRYPFPSREEPSASLQAQGRELFLITVDEKGCYSGKTHLSPDAAVNPVRIVPNQRLIIEYENSCLLTAAFTPREGARYWLSAVEGPVPDKPNKTSFQLLALGKQRQCLMGVTEMDDATQVLKPVQLEKLMPRISSFGCMKLGH